MEFGELNPCERDMKQIIYRKSNLVRVLIFAALLLSLLQCAPSNYSSKPIHAYVTDTDGNPLQDVIVVAYWKLDGGLEGGVNKGVVHVMETVTDENGRFDFPAWGPKKVPEGSRGGILKNESPGMVLYKEGYEYRYINNKDRHPPGFSRKVRVSDWTGKTIQLKSFSNTRREYSEMKNNLRRFLELSIIVNDNSRCQWKHFPKIIIALSTYGLIDIDHYKELIASVEVLDNEGCDSINEFVGRYRNER